MSYLLTTPSYILQELEEIFSAARPVAASKAKKRVSFSVQFGNFGAPLLDALRAWYILARSSLTPKLTGIFLRIRLSFKREETFS